MARANKMSIEDAIVSLEEQVYSLPKNWCWLKIGCVSNIYTGNSINEKIKAEKYEGQIEGPLFIATKDIGFDNVINYETNVRITDADNYKKAPINTALLCIEGGSAGKKVGFTNQEVCFGNKLCAFVSNVINPKYIYYYLQSEIFLYHFNKKKHGLIGGVSVKDIVDIPIALPPIEEQARIVEQIDNLFEKIDEAKNKMVSFLDNYQLIKDSIIDNAFTGELTKIWREHNSDYGNYDLKEIDIVASTVKKKKIKKVQNSFEDQVSQVITTSWNWVDLDRIAKQITDGEHKTPKRVEEFCGYYLLSARNIRNGKISLEDVDYVDLSEYEKISKRCNPVKGDVLISCSGSVGRVCVVDDDNNYSMVRSAAMVSLLAGIPKFVMYMLQSSYAQEQIRLLTKQTAQANLFLGAIAAIIIPFPNIDEQTIIVDILDRTISKLETSKELAETALNEIDNLKKSILTKAFCGALDTNIVTEESVLDAVDYFLKNRELTSKRNKIKPNKTKQNKNEYCELLLNDTEKKIISLFYGSNDSVVSMEAIMAISSDKFTLIETLRLLEKKEILIKLKNGNYRLKEK